jgi:hypothetical protein
MKINSTRTTDDIKKEFNNLFPGLKLEFYKVGHENHEGNKAKDQLTKNYELIELMFEDKSGELTINEEMTVNELESAFETKFGIHAQVFRKSNDLWLQTSATDDWTLMTQNTKGLHSGR